MEKMTNMNTSLGSTYGGGNTRIKDLKSSLKSIPAEFENLKNHFLISRGSFPRKEWICVFIYWHPCIGHYSREFDGKNWSINMRDSVFFLYSKFLIPDENENEDLNQKENFS